MCRVHACLLMSRYLDLEHAKQLIDFIIFQLSVLLHDSPQSKKKLKERICLTSDGKQTCLYLDCLHQISRRLRGDH